MARSSGEKLAVRPRIAPAFEQLAKWAERPPAGEILHAAPERLRAIAPLPVDKIRKSTDRAPRSDRSLEFRNITPGQVTLPPLISRETAAPRGSRTAKDHAISEVSVKPDEHDKTAPAVAKLARECGSLHPETEIATGEPTSPQVIQAIVSKPEAKEKLQFAAQPFQSALTPTAISELRPAVRKAELPLESPTKRPLAEPAPIQITIGRIEVRASMAAPKSSEKKSTSKPMSLHEYQRLRSRRSAE
jgi:hypothetical protein